MGQGFPLMAHNTGRVPTLSEVKRGAGKQLGLGIKSGLRDDRGVSQGFLYTESESESET
jgi:hypothetical protein